MTSTRSPSADLAGHDHSASVPEQVGATLIALVLALALAITVTLAAFVYAGAPYATMSFTAWCLALGGWLSFSRHRVRNVPVAFSLYVGTLVALMVLYSEQWYMRYPSTLMRYFPVAFPTGVGIGEHAFVAVFPLAVTAFMTLGALAYYRGTVFGDLAAWLVFAWGGVAALAIYLVGPLAGQPTGYVGGMLTAPAVLIVAAVGVVRLVRGSRGHDA
jgi:hypothetical protein